MLRKLPHGGALSQWSVANLGWAGGAHLTEPSTRMISASESPGITMAMGGDLTAVAPPTTPLGEACSSWRELRGRERIPASAAASVQQSRRRVRIGLGVMGYGVGSTHV